MRLNLKFGLQCNHCFNDLDKNLNFKIFFINDSFYFFEDYMKNRKTCNRSKIFIYNFEINQNFI